MGCLKCGWPSETDGAPCDDCLDRLERDGRVKDCPECTSALIERWEDRGTSLWRCGWCGHEEWFNLREEARVDEDARDREIHERRERGVQSVYAVNMCDE